MAAASSPLRVDRNTLRVNQAFIVGFTVLAFVVGDEVGRWFVLGTGLVMLLGTLDERTGIAPLLLEEPRVSDRDRVSLDRRDNPLSNGRFEGFRFGPFNSARFGPIDNRPRNRVFRVCFR